MQRQSGGSSQRSLGRSCHGFEEAPSPTAAWASSPLGGFASLLSCLEERLPGGLEAEAEAEAQSRLSSGQEEELEEESTESVLEPEPEPMKEEFDGVLTEDAIAETLHNLGRSAPGTEYVFRHLSLSDHGLSNIDVLSKYVHLQKLDLSYNKINDLSCVSHMPYLLELDVSHNELTTYFDFSPPKNLQIVNFSHNLISEMQDLSAYQALTTLILDYNNIMEIRGLEKCHSLTYLSLANNRLGAITGLKNLPIKSLCLKSNQIEKAVGLEDLKALRFLDLSSNRISSLEGLEEHSLLEEINIEDNQIAELGELEYIEHLPLLRVLNLLNNQVQQHKDYWLLVIFMLLRLTELDHKTITVQEKVAAVNKYDPPPEVVAAQDHMTHIMYSMMQPQRIFDSTLPSLDAPYPMLVLTGPLACWKRELCHRLCRKFNNYFRYSPCHTTRAPYFGEENRLDYYFVSQKEFDKLVNAGKFIATFKYSGYYYGLGRDTIESIAREGLATCVHLEIEGVKSLKNSYFEPRYILLIPISKEKYEGHLRRKGLFSRPEIEEAIYRVDMYIRVNQDFPGFFDAVINVDDYDEAFVQLNRLIEEFLGLSQPSESETAISVANSNLLSGPQIQKAESSIKGTDGVAPSPTPNEFLDSSARNYSSRISAKLSAQKTPVEEASLQRRQHTARQGLAGKATSSCSQLFQRDLASTPVPSIMHPRFLEPTSHTVPMMLSGPTLSPDRSLQPTSPDQSTKESRTTTGLSLLSPGALSSSSSSSRTPVAFSIPSVDETNGEQADRKELDLSTKKTEKTPKPKPASPSVPQITVRPGSNTKPVLPPIPSGQKKTKPLLAEISGSSFLLSPKP
ncbi:leucine-rich repeat and guanylate kinase domain-containing protein [Tiliqua scincoides]|uniref:leucine-rich repeat and guanylate kinase domain-containing protein n=1 Tax=Tiliqua scincoides TaxID=71010 RepID=UPI003461A96D